MHLYFLRHGIAEDAEPGQPDALRRLTDEGVALMHQEAKALAGLQLYADSILHSPRTRAMQTAEIVAAALGRRTQEEQCLGPGCNLDDLAEIPEPLGLSRGVMLVGHEPDFGRMVGLLIGGSAVEMKKGGVACVEVAGVEPNAGILHWLMTGKQLAALGRNNSAR